MKTATKKKAVKVQPQSTTANSVALEMTDIKGTLEYLTLSDLDISPLNYRKAYNAKAIAELAEGLLMHGMISAMTVRPVASGRYEVVAGERRYKAARLAGLTVVPAIIRVLTDEQVKEIQLVENLHREDPHPMHEAFAVLNMQQAGKSIDDIMLRLGKSKAFVYSRIKLAGLIEVMQDIFLADKVTIQEAFDIAALSAESQYEFYEQYCTDWQEEGFELNNIRSLLSRFRFDLMKAPFDTKDKKLVPEAGACTNCPFNSATLKLLFPETATTASCNNHVCYQSKCKTQLNKTVIQAIATHQPDALLHTGSFSTELSEAIAAIPQAAALLQYSRYDVTVFRVPTEPDKDDFDLYGDDEEGTGDGFDQDGYDEAIQDYQADLAEYESMAQSEGILKGLQLNTSGATLILFSKEIRQATANQTNVTAKEVQEAIKTGTVTTELLAGEIERINAREKRAKELDSEKVQGALHAQFTESLKAETLTPGITPADLIAARLLVYQSLDYSTIHAVNKALFSGKADTAEQKLEAIANLTNEQFAFLIRTAVAGKSESKIPGTINAICLYQVAQESGLDVAAIEEVQEQKATERQDKLEIRVKELETRKTRMEARKKAA